MVKWFFFGKGPLSSLSVQVACFVRSDDKTFVHPQSFDMSDSIRCLGCPCTTEQRNTKSRTAAQDLLLPISNFSSHRSWHLPSA